MNPAVIASLITALLLSNAATAAADPLCKPLRAFVASIKPDEKQTIEFHTSWGGKFKNDPDPHQAIWAKRCIDNGYSQAKPVCRVLMEHGLVEFSDRNAKKAIACLSPKTQFDPQLELSRVESHFSYGSPNRGAAIDISFAWNDDIGGMILKIDADGY